MKILISILMAAAGLTMTAISAHAALGDTYAESCRKFGSKGVVDKESRSVSWNQSDVVKGYWVISEWFVKNQCVAIMSVGSETEGMYESGIWRMLQSNSLPTHVWTEYSRDSQERDFMTTDGKLFGKYWQDSVGHPWLRIAYKSWLRGHNLFTVPSDSVSDRAPVEDSI